MRSGGIGNRLHFMIRVRFERKHEAVKHLSVWSFLFRDMQGGPHDSAHIITVAVPGMSHLFSPRFFFFFNIHHKLKQERQSGVLSFILTHSSSVALTKTS